jgi:hypothetical protein
MFFRMSNSRAETTISKRIHTSNGYVNGGFSLASPRVRSIGSTARVSAAEADWPGAHHCPKQNQARIAEEVHEQIIVMNAAVQPGGRLRAPTRQTGYQSRCDLVG